jgi:hypothetical protein
MVTSNKQLYFITGEPIVEKTIRETDFKRFWRFASSIFHHEKSGCRDSRQADSSGETII